METEVRVETVTPEMAAKWLAENRYEFQRNVRNDHVKFMAEEMLAGTFKQDGQIEFSVVNGQTWLTDGQHRLSALIWAGIPQRFVVTKRYLKDEVSAALDYTRTDQILVRSTSDIYKTLSLETELGISSTHVNALGVAVQLIDRKFSGKTRKMHPEIKLRLMREYNDALGMYLETIAGTRKELRHRLDRGATMAVALVTFRYSAKVYQQQRVEEFWNGTAMDDGLRADDPRKMALLHLTEMGMIGGGLVTSGKTVSPPYSARCLAICFNNWINNKSMKQKPRLADPTEPIVILGSPFNGK